MKKFRSLIFMFVLLLPVNVFAFSGGISLSCSKTEVTLGEQFSCLVSGESSEDIAAISANLNMGSGILAVGFAPATGWEGATKIYKNRISVYSAEPFKNSFNIGTITYEVASAASNGNVAIGFSDVIYGLDMTKYNVSGYSTNIKVVSGGGSTEKSYLSNLTVSGGTLSPTFSSVNSLYALTLDSYNTSKFSISAVPKNSADAVVAIDSDTGSAVNLSNINFATTGGKSTMSIQITVGLESSASTYTILVSRPSKPDEPVVEYSYLDSLTVSGGTLSPSFSKTKYSYSVTLNSSDTSKFSVSVVPSKTGDSVKAINSDIGSTIDLANITFAPPSGHNVMNIKITVGTGTTLRSYTLAVERPTSPLVEYSYLSNLTVNGGMLSPSFSKTKYSYMVVLDSMDTSEFSVVATPEKTGDDVVAGNSDTGGTIDLSNITFATTGGKSNMSIEIIVGTGNTAKTYTLVIAKPQVDSDEILLSSLVVGGKNVSLVKGVYEYEVVLDSVSSYSMKATLKDSSKYKLDNTFLSPTKLSGENTYDIVIDAADSTSGLAGKTYYITVKSSGNSSGGSGNSSSTSSGNGGNGGTSVSNNPSTGSASMIVMAFVLIISLCVSIYFYKRNIIDYNG